MVNFTHIDPWKATKPPVKKAFLYVFFRIRKFTMYLSDTYLNIIINADILTFFLLFSREAVVTFHLNCLTADGSCENENHHENMPI